MGREAFAPPLGLSTLFLALFLVLVAYHYGSGSQKAFTFAFVAAAMIYMVSHRSGGHVNPAMEEIWILLGQK